MSGIPVARLVDSFVDQLERADATVIRTRARDKDRPARIRVVSANGTTDCLLFLWTITPGGGGAGVRPATERRIQVTNAERFPLEPGCRTLIGGWNVEAGVWAFWDVRRHTRFSLNSPSFQVSSDALQAAAHLGVATHLRALRQAGETREVVVAVEPDYLLWYVESGVALHGSEDDCAGVALFADFNQETPIEERNFIDESHSEDQANRRLNLVETMRLYRDAKFRPAVLRAYRHRCAVCQVSLKLVDAAHIVPVTFPDSSDDVTNGLALCRLHHGAYDNGLLGVQSNYRIIMNPDSEARLETLQLHMGLEEFKARLPGRITIPASIEVRPNPQKLVLGLRARNWPTIHCA